VIDTQPFSLMSQAGIAPYHARITHKNSTLMPTPDSPMRLSP
jgi:hypothetical protein